MRRERRWVRAENSLPPRAPEKAPPTHRDGAHLRMSAAPQIPGEAAIADTCVLMEADSSQRGLRERERSGRECASVGRRLGACCGWPSPPLPRFHCIQHVPTVFHSHMSVQQNEFHQLLSSVTAKRAGERQGEIGAEMKLQHPLACIFLFVNRQQAKPIASLRFKTSPAHVSNGCCTTISVAFLHRRG